MRGYGPDYVHLTMPPGGEQLARSFYRDLLGLAEIVRSPNPASHKGLWFRANNVQVHLGIAPDWPAVDGCPSLLVEDLRQVVDRLLQAGYEATFDLEPPRGFRRAFASDPFGNQIELVQQGTRF
jgi:catechol 2,3-dioxygenase-like lactoylglutathione lyase family enzyme